MRVITLLSHVITKGCIQEIVLDAISKKIEGAQIANYTPHLALVMAVSDPGKGS
jgi:hypothetical protein